MKMRLITVAVLVAFLSLLVAPAQTSAKPKPKGSVPVAATDGTFKGQFLLKSAELTGNNTGLTLIGDIVGADGQLVAADQAWPVDMAKTQARNAPAALAGNVNALVTCDILNLVLAPLHLDLLGLVVDLNQVTLNITAEQAPGNLLGNLLCSVAHLLNGPSPLGGLTALLNNILRVLGGA